MSTAIQKQSQEIEGFLTQAAGQIRAVLPQHLTPERMIRVALHASTRNPELLNCSKESFLSAIIDASEMGLEPVGPMGEAALVPYKGVVQFQPMYRGLVKLARQSAEIADIHAEVVCENDTFEFHYAIPQDHLFHQLPRGKRGAMQGAWARAIFRDGTQKVMYYDAEKIERIRRMSKQAHGIMWKDHWDEAAKKTVIKALCKTLPLSSQLARAIELDNQAEVDLTEYEEAPARMQMPRRKSDPIEVTPEPAPAEDSIGPECPEGHGPMTLRDGKYGPFWSCSTYPKCKEKLTEKKWKEQQKKAAAGDAKERDALLKKLDKIQKDPLAVQVKDNDGNSVKEYIGSLDPSALDLDALKKRVQRLQDALDEFKATETKVK